MSGVALEESVHDDILGTVGKAPKRVELLYSPPTIRLGLGLRLAIAAATSSETRRGEQRGNGYEPRSGCVPGPVWSRARSLRPPLG
jgi:hypothetical protein